MVRIRIADDSVGGIIRQGSGLEGLADRIAALDGHFMLASPDGLGTIVGRRSRAGSCRRRLDPAARRWSACSGRRFRGGRAGRVTPKIFSRRVSAHKPDVAVVDIRMPPNLTDDGLQAAKEDPGRTPGHRCPRAFPVSGGSYALDRSPTRPKGRLPAGRTGSLKSIPSPESVRRVGAAARPSTRGGLPPARPAAGAKTARGLTVREREVLGLMAEAARAIAIAENLVVTERAVEKHVTSIFSSSTSRHGRDHRRAVPHQGQGQSAAEQTTTTAIRLFAAMTKKSRLARALSRRQRTRRRERRTCAPR